MVSIEPPGPALSGVQYMTPDNTTPLVYQTIKTHTKSHPMQRLSYSIQTTTSSDTLDASGVSLLSGTYLTPTTTVDINTEPTELRTLHRIVGSEMFFHEFTTYISIAGGG